MIAVGELVRTSRVGDAREAARPSDQPRSGRSGYFVLRCRITRPFVRILFLFKSNAILFAFQRLPLDISGHN